MPVNRQRRSSEAGHALAPHRTTSSVLVRSGTQSSSLKNFRFDPKLPATLVPFPNKSKDERAVTKSLPDSNSSSREASAVLPLNLKTTKIPAGLVFNETALKSCVRNFSVNELLCPDLRALHGQGTFRSKCPLRPFLRFTARPSRILRSCSFRP